MRSSGRAGTPDERFPVPFCQYLRVKYNASIEEKASQTCRFLGKTADGC